MYRNYGGLYHDRDGNLDDRHAENWNFVSAMVNNFLKDDGDRFELWQVYILRVALLIFDEIRDYVDKEYIQYNKED